MNIIKLVGILALTHALLAIVPWFILETSATASLPYHSYFTMAQLLNGLGLPVIGSFHEGMFMARVTVLGKGMIAGAWFVVYVLAALLIDKIRS